MRNRETNELERIVRRVPARWRDRYAEEWAADLRDAASLGITEQEVLVAARLTTRRLRRRALGDVAVGRTGPLALVVTLLNSAVMVTLFSLSALQSHHAVDDAWARGASMWLTTLDLGPALLVHVTGIFGPWRVRRAWLIRSLCLAGLATGVILNAVTIVIAGVPSLTHAAWRPLQSLLANPWFQTSLVALSILSFAAVQAGVLLEHRRATAGRESAEG